MIHCYKTFLIFFGLILALTSEGFAKCSTVVPVKGCTTVVVHNNSGFNVEAQHLDCDCNMQKPQIWAGQTKNLQAAITLENSITMYVVPRGGKDRVGWFPIKPRLIIKCHGLTPQGLAGKGKCEAIN